MKASTTACATLVLGLAGCAVRAPARPDEAAIRSAIAAQEARIGAMFATKDTATLGSLFTDDAVWILPDASTFRGRANIVAGGKAFFASFDSAAMGASAIDKLIVVNDSEAVTFSHGSYTMVVHGKSSGPRVNPYADYWRKGADGTWRIAYEVNADGAAPAPSAGATTSR